MLCFVWILFYTGDDELKRREAFAEQLGGSERVKRQHDAGRYTVREREPGRTRARSAHQLVVAERPARLIDLV